MSKSSQQSAVVEGANVYEQSCLADEAIAPKHNDDAVRRIPAAKRSLRVLVADDNLDVADSVSMLVRMWGHEVQRTYDGAAVLKIISTYRPDAVLLDAALAETEGCFLARQAHGQAQFKDILLIAMAERAEEAHRPLCEETGFDHILKKPIEPATLENLLLLQQGRLAEPAETPRSSGRKYGIFIVDEDNGVRGVLKVQMQQEGFDVRVAANGYEALDVYRRHRDTIDVVLLDVLMPGLDGTQTMLALHKLNPRITCCLMGGNVGDYTEAAFRNLGAAAFFPKPFRLAQVTQVVWKLARKANSNGVLSGEANGTAGNDSLAVFLCEGN
jgi:DNA-binding response OmpR family regulator